MVTNNGFEEQLRKLISETQDEINKVEEQLKNYENKRLALNEELQSFEHSLHSYLRRTGKEKEEKSPTDWIGILGSYNTHKERLLAIAEHNNNTLRFNSAVDILYNNKYTKSKSRANAYVQLYNVVVDMVDDGLLKKTRRGIYKLIKPTGRLF
jgi:septal ring factor EnvC (AmiA/AmiB activator)